MHPLSHNTTKHAGFSMVEVLVTLIILMVGLLGLAGLMVQSQRSEMESYQRIQALILLQDMVGRINTNRNAANCYAFTSNTANGTPYVGTTGTGILTTIPPSCTIGTTTQISQFQRDINDWNQLLLGAAETSGGSNTGAMIGARGCISYDSSTELNQLDTVTGLPTGTTLPGTGLYTVSVAWQGMGDTFANTGLACAQGQYGAETKRRVVSLPFRIGALQ